jgi:hypothetical protein
MCVSAACSIPIVNDAVALHPLQFAVCDTLLFVTQRFLGMPYTSQLFALLTLPLNSVAPVADCSLLLALTINCRVLC